MKSSKTRRSFPSRLVLLAVLVLLAAACGESTIDAGASDGGDPDGGNVNLVGRQFWATEVVEVDGVRELVAGTRISLDFDVDTLGASAGCNSAGGGYRLDEGLLIVEEMFMTEIGCDADRHAQDEFLVTFLGRSPSVELEGNELRLTSGEETLVLTDTSVANPDRPIIGTIWEVNGFIDGDIAMAMATDAPGTVVFNDDSTMSIFDGCRDIVVMVEVSDGSIGGPVNNDGELQFGLVDPATSEECSQPDYVAAVRTVFESAAAGFNIDGTQLTILNVAGSGVTLTAVG